VLYFFKAIFLKTVMTCNKYTQVNIRLLIYYNLFVWKVKFLYKQIYQRTDKDKGKLNNSVLLLNINFNDN